MIKRSAFVFALSLVFLFRAGVSDAQVTIDGVEVIVKNSYSRTPNGQYFAVRMVILRGEGVNREIRFGLREVDEVIGNLGFEALLKKQMREANLSSDQKAQFAINDIKFYRQLKNKIFDFPIDGSEQKLFSELESVLKEKEKQDETIWLPHQQVIRKQVYWGYQYKDDPLKAVLSAKFQSELGLSKEQVKSLKELSTLIEEKTKERKSALDSEVKLLQEDRERQILAEVEAANRQKLKMLLKPAGE